MTLMTDDEGELIRYAWDRCWSKDGQAPFPVVARLLALAEGAERVDAYEAVSGLGAPASWWAVTWVLPNAIAHVSMRRESDPDWAAGRHEQADKALDSDVVEEAWLRPLSSVTALRARGAHAHRDRHTEGMRWRVETSIVFDDGTEIDLEAPEERSLRRLDTHHVGEVARLVRSRLLGGDPQLGDGLAGGVS